MPFNLNLNTVLRQAGWKVKIHDAERLEPPHVTIYQKNRRWRLSLRSGQFLERGSKWSQIDSDVMREIQSAWQCLQDEWDRIHPSNPISSEDEGK